MNHVKSASIATLACALMCATIFSGVYVVSKIDVDADTIASQSVCVKTALAKDAHGTVAGVRQRDLGAARGACNEIAADELEANNG